MSNQNTLHPRNKGNSAYDFEELSKVEPDLKQFIIENERGEQTIDFANAVAVKLLNSGLLKSQYGLTYWDIPAGYLCPPIPGRADYLHYAADLLATSNNGVIPTGDTTRCLDIGSGANCVYPVVGNNIYGWHFVGSDIDAVALENARNIIEKNPHLKDKIEIREQTNRNAYFENIIQSKERYHLSICNPPFHASIYEAQESNARKVANLGVAEAGEVNLNFGGQNAELWTRGGEVKFIRKMIIESVNYADKVLWFSSLVSKNENLRAIYGEFAFNGITNYKTIEMAQGNKISRFVAWSFIPENEHTNWF